MGSAGRACLRAPWQGVMPIIFMAEYVHLTPNQNISNFDFTKPYRAAVIIESNCSNTWRNEVSDLLVISGCKYMCAWGIDCTLWDDSVDWSCIEILGDSEKESVMTTWHDKESLKNAFQFFKYDAKHPYINIDKTIIFHVSNTVDQERIINEFENA